MRVTSNTNENAKTNEQMNWNNYLLEKKGPYGDYAHLGVFEGAVRRVFDLSTIPTDTKILEMSTPLKKFKLTYTNLSSLNANKNIEAIILGEIDNERVFFRWSCLVRRFYGLL